MCDKAEVDQVSEFFRQHGFAVERIAETPAHCTPDLIAQNEQSRLLVEVKAKRRDEQLSRLMRQARGATAHYSRTPVETELRGGYRQLRDWPGRQRDDYLLLLYLTSPSLAPDIVAGTVRSLLFGLETLEGYTEPGKVYYQKACFYFHHNFFFRRKELNGLILENRGNLELCVNSFAANYPGFRSTRLFEIFASTYQATDPLTLEQEGDCFVLDSSHPRGDVNRSVRLLREKYGLGKPRIYQYCLVNYPLD